MTFCHAPTSVSLAIGAGFTLLDLYIYQRLAFRRMLEELETARLRAGGSVLDALQNAGLVEVRRDASGEIDRIISRASQTTVLCKTIDLIREDLHSRYHRRCLTRA